MVKQKKKSPQTGMDRLKAVPLWQWGLITIFSGVVANVVMGMQAATGSAAARRGAALGRGVASSIFIVIGIALVVAHFVRKKAK